VPKLQKTIPITHAERETKQNGWEMRKITGHGKQRTTTNPVAANSLFTGIFYFLKFIFNINILK